LSTAGLLGIAYWQLSFDKCKLKNEFLVVLLSTPELLEIAGLENKFLVVSLSTPELLENCLLNE
jgi:hypothetical protein